MNFILNQIEKKIQYFESASSTSELISYYRVKIEYALVSILGLLWNKNLHTLESDEKEYIFSKIFQPTIGAVVDIIRTLDKKKELFSNKALYRTLNSYPSFRNEKLGHGYVFEDQTDVLYKEIKSISDNLYAVREIKDLLNHDLVLVTNCKDNVYNGINFKNSGEYIHWRCPVTCSLFDCDNLYAYFADDSYQKLSPFTVITSEGDIFIFRDIYDRLVGKFRYNRLIKTGVYFCEWRNLELEIENDGLRRRTQNGTVINAFKNNYRKFIEVANIKKELKKFLIENRASVCATVWGHGGVGKTATVQSVCEDLTKSYEKKFDYIIFVSAKDRFYNYYTGAITQISDSIDSFDSLLKSITATVGINEGTPEDEIIKFEGRLLLIIDDYETFPLIEKNKIENFIKKLDIDKHKVIITTRANIVIGQEFQTNEFNKQDSVAFLTEVIRSEFPDVKTDNIKGEFENEEIIEGVYSTTSGRPLFIFQLALLWAQTGSITQTLKRDIKKDPEAIEFLYGRIYQYLSENAKKLFVAMSQLVTEEDLSNLLEKLQFIVNLENEEDTFNSAIKELIKLKIIEVFDNDFFRVYSKEILQLMSNYFEKAAIQTRRGIISRIKQVTRDKKLDNEHALLENANAARYAKSEEEVISLFRHILQRSSCPIQIKSLALLNLTEYLFNNRGKRDLAVRTFKDFEHLFSDDPIIIKMYSSYCWALDRKSEAIRILSDFFSKKPNFGGNNNLRIELAGLCLTYQAIDSIQIKEEIKLKYRFSEISYVEFANQNDELKIVFSNIFRFGIYLFNSVRNYQDLNRLSASARQNLLTGLYQLSNICIRIRKYDNAKEICDFGIKHSSEYLNNEFRSKIKFLDTLKKK